MKNSLKLISLYAAIAAIFSLGACDTKSESSETALIKGLRITASQSVDSRTTFNGEASSWVAGDCLNVLISGGNFLSPTAKEFTITDVSKSVFANDQVEINTHSTY